MTDDKPEAETTRRFVNNRDTQIGTGNLAGLTFGQDKWKYPYEAAVQHPAEFIRQTEGGFGVTQAVSDSVFGAPDKDIWSDGPVQGIYRTIFTPEGFGHGTGGGMKFMFMPTNDEFRKNTPPLPVFSKFTWIGAMFGAAHSATIRYSLRMPMYSAIHRTAFTMAIYAWGGYQLQKLLTMKNVGQYKMAVDFAERHSDIIFKQEPAKFSDPEILEHYIKMGGKGHTG